MADTRRSLSALQTLLADNTSQAISPQDLRDFLYSASPPHGTIYISTPAETSIAEAGTFYKAAGTTTSRNLKEFDMPVDGRLRYTGTPDIHVHVAATVAMTAAGSNIVVSMRLVKNGDETLADAVASETDRKIGTGADVGSTALHFDTTMSTNDYLELYVRNETTTANVTINHLYLFALGMLT